MIFAVFATVPSVAHYAIVPFITVLVPVRVVSPVPRSFLLCSPRTVQYLAPGAEQRLSDFRRYRGPNSHGLG